MQLTAIIDAVQWAIPSAGSAFSSAVHTFAQAAAPMVATALWQGIAVAAALALGLRLAPRMPAAQRFSVWAAGFAMLIVLPLLPLFAHLASPALSAASIHLDAAAAKPWLQLDARWSVVLLALWLAASAFRAADLAVHTLHLRKLWKQATPLDASSIHLAPFALPTASWLRKAAQVCTTQQLDRPSVIGFFAPRILIPAWLLPKLTPEELQQVILHEAQHLRRGDDWTNLFQKLCLVLFPLNPSLWWIERRLCQEREMACDDGVIRITQAPRAYAACLASLAERGLQHRAQALSLGAWQRRPELVQRVHRLLRHTHAFSPRATRAVLAILCGVLLVGSVELARCPQLVAFVPAHPAPRVVAQAHNSAQPVPARLINTAFVESNQSLPATHRHAHAKHTALVASAAPQHNASAPYVALEARVPSTHVASSSLQHMPQAQLTASSVAVEPQQWLVVTTWEQVQTTSRAPRTVEDYDTSSSATQSDAVVNPQSRSQVTSQFTVTQLIFKVLPANSKSTQPIAVPVRNGWFVIQL